MRHCGCPDVGTEGQTDTPDTNAARKYCKMGPTACECTLHFALLSEVACSSAAELMY